MVSPAGSGIVLNYQQITTAGALPGKVSVPVSSSVSAYANFRHVQGVPAREGGQAYSLNKVKVMDVMIEHLQARKTEREKMFSELGTGDGLQRMLEEIHRKIQDGEAAGPYGNRLSVPPLLIDLYA